MGYTLGVTVDPNLITFSGIVLVALLGGAVTIRQGKGSSADDFRGDLLTRVAQQDIKISAQDTRLEKQSAELEDLRRKRDELREEINVMRASQSDQIAERDSRIIVLTDWGTHSDESRPRTPPHWRQV